MKSIVIISQTCITMTRFWTPFNPPGNPGFLQQSLIIQPTKTIQVSAKQCFSLRRWNRECRCIETDTGFLRSPTVSTLFTLADIKSQVSKTSTFFLSHPSLLFIHGIILYSNHIPLCCITLHTDSTFLCVCVKVGGVNFVLLNYYFRRIPFFYSLSLPTLFNFCVFPFWSTPC